MLAPRLRRTRRSRVLRRPSVTTLLSLLLPRAARAQGSACWDEKFTHAVCCGDPPLRDDCWLPEAGISREACCEEAENPETNAAANARALDFVHAAYGATVLLGYENGCWGAVHHLEAVLRKSPAYGSDEADGLAAKFLEATRGRQPASRCWDPMARTRSQMVLLEALLAQINHESDMGAGMLGEYVRQGSRVIATVNQRSKRRWAHASRLPPLDARLPSMHVAMVASVGSPPFGKKALAGVRSALYFAKLRPLTFHLLVDEAGEEDMKKALGTLDPWLRAKGTFKLYRVDALQHVWTLLRATVPRDCLNFNSYYGSAGWLRLFAHEFLDLGAGDDGESEVVAWVDAGDYVFLDDPALLLQYQSAFSEEHIVAAPKSHALPFQLFDLKRMRERDWTSLVRQATVAGYEEEGAEHCSKGEGLTVAKLTSMFPNIWLWLPSRWAYEPWMDWVPGFGVKNTWEGRERTGQIIWSKRPSPGVDDFMTLRVHCPDFLQAFVYNFLSRSSFSRSTLRSVLDIAAHGEVLASSNASYIDEKHQGLYCNERAQGVHFVMPFHHLPWVHRFLGFWAGSDVWDKTWYWERDLSVPEF
eukprot:TRINITY_DN22693_c0_g1_i1.p1 TRINITY_DN22693_c0_g1~~TRINITY_DN22693_c0_g1_i1.p1  ORF type:complete len:587 (+),score=138.67 TRINITY_DN22693_c0_g1_i1:224-1984(+)